MGKRADEVLSRHILVIDDAIRYNAAMQGVDKLQQLHHFVAQTYQVDVTFSAKLSRGDEPVVEYMSADDLRSKFNIDITFEND